MIFCDVSKLPIFEHFLSVGNLKPKLIWFFKPKLKPLNWAPVRRERGHLVDTDFLTIFMSDRQFCLISFNDRVPALVVSNPPEHCLPHSVVFMGRRKRDGKKAVLCPPTGPVTRGVWKRERERGVIIKIRQCPRHYRLLRLE